MGFKTENKEITLKDFCKFEFINGGYEVILYDYDTPMTKPAIVLESDFIIDDIAEKYQNWLVKFVCTEMYTDASDITNIVYGITIHNPEIN